MSAPEFRTGGGWNQIQTSAWPVYDWDLNSETGCCKHIKESVVEKEGKKDETWRQSKLIHQMCRGREDKAVMGWELEIGDVGWGPVSSMEEAATGTKRDASSVWCTTRMKASPCLDAAKPNMSTEHRHWFVAGWCGKVGCWPNQNTWKGPKYIRDPF